MANTLTETTNSLRRKGIAVLDSTIPPKKREELFEQTKSFAIEHPRLSAFLFAHILLSGAPVVMFLLFTVGAFIFSLVSALLFSLLVALVFTSAMVGMALLFLLPLLFFTTTSATFMFLWGLAGLYLLRWLNKGKSHTGQGEAFGDRLNDFTGGRMSLAMKNMKKNRVIAGSETGSKDEKDGHKDGEDGQNKTNGAQKPTKIITLKFEDSHGHDNKTNEVSDQRTDSVIS